MLGRRDDGGGRVARQLAGEDGGVDDEDVVGAVDAGVGVDDGGAVGGAAVVGAHFGGAFFVWGGGGRVRYIFFCFNSSKNLIEGFGVGVEGLNKIGKFGWGKGGK